MNKAVSFLKKISKLILWVIISFLLLFFVIAVLIQIPAIQKKVANYATSFISNKTHTKVEIKKINISFPKSIVIEGLYLEDIKKDTLLFAGEVNINISFTDLINHRIHVSSLGLKELNLHLSRTESDSLFNYNFLLTAFSDTAKLQKLEPPNKSKWEFNIDDVTLNNILLHYDDDYGGINIAGSLNHLELKMDKIDLEHSIYDIDELLIEGLTGSVLVKKSSVPNGKKSENILPKISANKVWLNNTIFSYADSVSKQSLIAGINQLMLKDAGVNLQKQIVLVDNITLSKSYIQYKKNDKINSDSAVVLSGAMTERNDWKVSVSDINLDDNSVAYLVVNKPLKKNSFDIFHLDYKSLTLKAKNFNYSTAKTEVTVKEFKVVDQNKFSITKFETNFKMDQHSITAQKLLIKTAKSSIEANLSLNYSSLKSLEDSLQFMIINADLKNVSIQNSDIIYFSPQLSGQPFFNNVLNKTAISGVIMGPLNNLKGKNIEIQTGANTILKTDFIVLGLPSIKTTYFNFPNLKIYSGSKDINMIAGTSIPQSIELPENLGLQIAFKGKVNSFESTVAIGSSYGSANLSATIDKNENFMGKVSIADFDLGRFLKNNKMFGKVSLKAEAEGRGLTKKTIYTTIQADVSQIYLNNYTYHDLKLNGNIRGQEFEGKINLNDENAVFDFDGLVNLNPNESQYKFNLNVKAADLQKLNITKDSLKIGLIVAAGFKGESLNEMNGMARISNIFIVHADKKYLLDSVIITSLSEPNRSELNISSALIGLKYSGTAFPTALPGELSKFINNYFPFSDSILSKEISGLLDFNFEIQLHNHPILSEVFLPELKEFVPGLIEGSFNAKKNELKIKAAIKKVVYGPAEIRDLVIDVNSNPDSLNYKIFTKNISNSQIKVDNLLVDGKLGDNKINANITSLDSLQNKKVVLHALIVRKDANYRLMLEPTDFYLMNERWDIATDNYIEFGKPGFLIHHLYINRFERQINVASLHDEFNDDLKMEIKNFELSNISRIIEKDTGLIKGNMDGILILKRVSDSYGLIADATISNLFVRGIPVGNLFVKGENPIPEKFIIDINLSGAGNNLAANGYFNPKGGENSIRIQSAIQSLSMETVKAFSIGNITEASGNLSGKFLIEGKTAAPEITGELLFSNVFITPAALNNRLQLKHETVQLKKDGIYFNSFTILDTYQHTAIIDGTVKATNFQNLVFALNVKTNDFLLFNTTMKDNKEFYGRMIIDSKIGIKGPLDLPVVNARLKMKKGSNFTFAVPEEKLNTDKGNEVVEFDDPLKLNQILSGPGKKGKKKSGLTGFDISSIIEIDKEATLRLLIDPSSSDSLVVKGEAALSFAIDRSGKMSLTGAYNINEGLYLVSLESVIKRKFIIDPGSTIIWNGAPLDAEISINAIYSVRASPIDLIADQVSGMTESDKNAYKQRYPFLVYLKLRGEISHPEINFEIQLAPEDKGILGGAVNAKLNMLNEDPSLLNKQVFALLVLGRFIQENPLQTETNGAAIAARTTVGKFLSAQLNQWSSKVVPGVELNFDVQSYEDYPSGKAEGRTQVDIGIKKQLFNERLSVQVGGIVDVEGEKAKGNSASDITSDVIVEYKLTDDARYRLKGFRHNQYEGAIEGQLVETGAGVLFVRDFNKWKELFSSPKIQMDSSKITDSNDTLNLK